MTRLRRWLRWLLVAFLVLALIGAAVAGGLYYAISSDTDTPADFACARTDGRRVPGG